MRNYDSATAAYLASRGGTIAHRLVQIAARNIATGLVENIALWSGEYDLTVTIAGDLRTYVGAGTLLQTDAITAGPGLAVRVHQLRMAAVAPEVESLVKEYDTRFAPVEMHRAFFHPSTRALVSEPHRVFRGLINSIDFPTEAPGASPTCVIEMVSEARILTRTLALKKSDESQKKRGGDRFRRFGDVSAAVAVFWGEKRVSTKTES